MNGNITEDGIAKDLAWMKRVGINFRAVVGDGLIGRHGIRAIVNDSTEVAASNWTPRLSEQFQQRRGYDARPWLPTLLGVIVGSRSQSDAFLYDLRRTLAELTATEHYPPSI